MKKIEDTRFFCIDFINCDLSRDVTIDDLIEAFLHPGNERLLKRARVQYGISHSDPSRWKRALLENTRTLKKIQKCILELVHRCIGRIQRNRTAGDSTIKDSILEEAEKLAYRLGSVSDPVTSFVASGLIRDLTELYKGDCWNRIIRCSMCNKFFIARTIRPQRFCSDKCRSDYHNRDKRATGKHTEYMRKYLPDYRKRKAGTK